MKLIAVLVYILLCWHLGKVYAYYHHFTGRQARWWVLQPIGISALIYALAVAI